MDIYNQILSSISVSTKEFCIGTVMSNPEMLKCVPDHLKTKNMCKHTVKKLTYLLRYVPDQYKTQQMDDKAILENDGTINSIPNC